MDFFLHRREMMSAVRRVSAKILKCKAPSPLKCPPLVHVEGFEENPNEVEDPRLKSKPYEAEAEAEGINQYYLPIDPPPGFFIRTQADKHADSPAGRADVQQATADASPPVVAGGLDEIQEEVTPVASPSPWTATADASPPAEAGGPSRPGEAGGLDEVQEEVTPVASPSPWTAAADDSPPPEAEGDQQLDLPEAANVGQQQPEDVEESIEKAAGEEGEDKEAAGKKSVRHI